MAIAEDFVRLLPAGPRAARLREIRERLPETWFSWIGGHRPGDVFYYRVQSPVIIAELDHHCGVFLDYDTPQPFHIHTVLRTPHGNDYGRAYVQQSGSGDRASQPDRLSAAFDWQLIVRVTLPAPVFFGGRNALGPPTHGRWPWLRPGRRARPVWRPCRRPG